MSAGFDRLMRQFEPDAALYGNEVSDRALASIAVSLKRIADAMEAGAAAKAQYVSRDDGIRLAEGLFPGAPIPDDVRRRYGVRR